MQKSENVSALIGLLDRAGNVEYTYLHAANEAQKMLPKHYNSTEKMRELLAVGSIWTLSSTPQKCNKISTENGENMARICHYNSFSTGDYFAGSVDVLYLFDGANWHKKQGTDIQPFNPFA